MSWRCARKQGLIVLTGSHCSASPKLCFYSDRYGDGPKSRMSHRVCAMVRQTTGHNWRQLQSESELHRQCFQAAGPQMSQWRASRSVEQEPMGLIVGHSWSAFVNSVKSPRQTRATHSLCVTPRPPRCRAATTELPARTFGLDDYCQFKVSSHLFLLFLFTLCCEMQTECRLCWMKAESFISLFNLLEIVFPSVWITLNFFKVLHNTSLKQLNHKNILSFFSVKICASACATEIFFLEAHVAVVLFQYSIWILKSLQTKSLWRQSRVDRG